MNKLRIYKGERLIWRNEEIKGINNKNKAIHPIPTKDSFLRDLLKRKLIFPLSFLELNFITKLAKDV